jgi:hypothetical protein
MIIKLKNQRTGPKGAVEPVKKKFHLIGGWVGPQSRSGHCGVEKNLFPLLGIEP